MEPTASIVIPTRDRLPYLEIALRSIAPQAVSAAAEVLVVDDAGPSEQARALVERHGARYEPQARPTGLNAARNSGVLRSQGALVVFVDDDVRAHEGWLAALLLAAGEHPEVDVFAGRILASLEGPAPRGCGGERPPVTTLDLGTSDAPVEFAWGSNMAIRRTALQAVGAFDETLQAGGDEQEWQERARRLRRSGASVDATATAQTRSDALYVAGAAVDHVRLGRDAGLAALCRTAHVRGRAARRFDARRGVAPSTLRELATLAACVGHVARRRCAVGLTMVAHSAGRLRTALQERAPLDAPAPAAPAPQDDFLSGHGGRVAGVDAMRRRARDELAQARELLGGRSLRLALAARHAPPLRRVLALAVVRPEHAARADAIAAELLSSRHDVRLHFTAPGTAGKFENLNALLAEHPAEGHDWLLVIDDDIELPHGFLDRFLFLAERFDFTLCQPAHVLDSHAAWEVTRRRPGSVARETRFVEIGPVTGFQSRSFDVLLPFPALRMGWGLDVHWAALAREHGWRCGVLDAVAIRHRQAPAATAYGREEAVAEARSFLAERPYLSAAEAEQTLATHSRW
jgi:hypothetical protein